MALSENVGEDQHDRYKGDDGCAVNSEGPEGGVLRDRYIQGTFAPVWCGLLKSISQRQIMSRRGRGRHTGPRIQEAGGAVHADEVALERMRRIIVGVDPPAS